MNKTDIANQFATTGMIVEIKVHGGGHINDSYHLINDSQSQPDYLMQRINHYVFKDVDLLMQNMILVTDHIADKILKVGLADPERRYLKVIPTKEGNSCFKDQEGNYWRVLNFINDHVAFERTADPVIAYEGARMFGEFSTMLDDLPAKKVGTIIPDFHNMKWRLTQLKEAVKNNKAGRLELIKKELDYIGSRSGLMLTVHELGETGAIPLRITHNDTKISNVWFDTDSKGLCVIDLDTIQPGYITSDFGNGIRTLTNTGEEDDKDLDSVTMDMELYKAFASGFLDSTREILSDTEKDALLYAGLLFPYMQGVRFLIDYLDGDLYYKTGYSEHNLVRTRAQLKLAQDGEAKMDQMKSIINKLK